MRFTKIKYNGKTITLNLLIPDQDEAAKLTYENDDVPDPAFQGAMQDLYGTFCELLELPDAYAEKLEIRGVTMKWENLKDERPESVLISAVRYTDQNGAASLNTPNCKAFSTEAAQLVWRLHEEAEGYLLGKRATLDLFAQQLADSLERMRPKTSNGIAAIEITAGGKGIRLTPETTEAIG